MNITPVAVAIGPRFAKRETTLAPKRLSLWHLLPFAVSAKNTAATNNAPKGFRQHLKAWWGGAQLRLQQHNAAAEERERLRLARNLPKQVAQILEAPASYGQPAGQAGGNTTLYIGAVASLLAPRKTANVFGHLVRITGQERGQLTLEVTDLVPKSVKTIGPYSRFELSGTRRVTLTTIEELSALARQVNGITHKKPNWPEGFKA